MSTLFLRQEEVKVREKIDSGSMYLLFCTFVVVHSSAVCFWDRSSVCSLDWPGTGNTDEAGLKLKEIHRLCLCLLNAETFKSMSLALAPSFWVRVIYSSGQPLTHYVLKDHSQLFFLNLHSKFWDYRQKTPTFFLEIWNLLPSWTNFPELYNTSKQ